MKPGISWNLWKFQGFHEIPDSLRDFVKSLKFPGISWNPWKMMPGISWNPWNAKRRNKRHYIWVFFLFIDAFELKNDARDFMKSLKSQKEEIKDITYDTFFYLLMHLNEKRFQGFHEIPEISKEAIKDIIYEIFFIYWCIWIISPNRKHN